MIDWVLGLIGGILYPLFSVIFVAIGAVQGIFEAFAGIGDMSFGASHNYGNLDDITSGNSGAENDTGLIYYLFNNSLIKNLLISIMLLALFLIIIFTVMAFIKNAYAAKPKNWKEIIGSAIKGLANFIFVPVCCLLGVWLGNILLEAINGATSGLSGGRDMSRKLFIAAAYNSNEFRSGVDPNAVADPEKVQDLKQFIDQFGSVEGLFGEIIYEKDEDGVDTETVDEIENLEEGRTNAYYAGIVDYIYANSKVSIYDWGMVEYWYKLHEINYLVLVIGGVFMLYALGSLAFAMVRRMFILLMLFVISPGVCAMFPLDDGKAVGQWKGEFIKQVLSAYGAIAGINIFFSLMPLIDNLHLGTGWLGYASGIGFVDDIVQLFVLVVGLLCVKELISMISGFVGGEDAYSKGTSTMKAATGAVKKYATGTAGVFAKAAGAKAGGGSFFGSLFKQAGSAAAGTVFDAKKVKDTYKGEKEATQKRILENYDSRNKSTIKSDDAAFETLMKNAGNGKVDRQAVFEFLNSIKDENAKKKYEEQIIRHDNRWAMTEGKKIGEGALAKEGKYIEDAKAYKEYTEKTLPGQEKILLRARAKVDEAEADVTTIETAIADKITEAMGEIHGGVFAATGYSNAELQALLDSKQTIDITSLDTEAERVAASEFNQYVNSIAEQEKKLVTAQNRVATVQESLADAIENVKDSVSDFAKSIKFKIDTSKLDTEVNNIGNAVGKTTTEFTTAVEDAIKELKDLNKLK